jgi:hypothetical protein
LVSKVSKALQNAHNPVPQAALCQKGIRTLF